MKSISIDRLSETDISCTAVVTLTYSSGVLDIIPDKLFMQVAEWRGTRLALEVGFYQSVGPLIQNGILLGCYGISSSVDSGIYCILLQEVSHTHILNSSLDDIDWYKSEYDPAVARQIIDGFVDIHSLFWGDQGVELGTTTRDELLLDEGMLRGNQFYFV